MEYHQVSQDSHFNSQVDLRGPNMRFDPPEDSLYSATQYPTSCG